MTDEPGDPGARLAAEAAAAGGEIYELLAELYPICRSISGDGVRRSFQLVQEHLALEVTEVPTGTEVFDWVVPREWNVRDAWISDPTGRRVVDFNESNLHVLGYSTPIRAENEARLV